MNKEHLTVFSEAVMNVIPMLGISDIKQGPVKEYGRSIETSGIVCIVGIIGDLVGNVIYSMTEEGAKGIASAMMGGMEVLEMDELTQSAISELSNMLSANACIGLEALDLHTDISTPTMMQGIFTLSGSYDSCSCLKMWVNGFRFDVYVSLAARS
jgi:chemotaxis protein CheX